MKKAFSVLLSLALLLSPAFGEGESEHTNEPTEELLLIDDCIAAESSDSEEEIVDLNSMPGTDTYSDTKPEPYIPKVEPNPTSEPIPTLRLTERAAMQSVTLTTADLKPGLNETVPLTLAPTPSDAVIDSIAYKSSSPAIATVSEDGQVTTHREGSVTISANVVSGSVRKTVSLRLTVVDRKKPVSAVLEASASGAVPLGDDTCVRLTLRPDTAVPDKVTYTCIPSTVAVVSEDGTITPLKEGTATITATVVYGRTRLTARTRLTVVDPKKPTSVQLTAQSTALQLEDSVQLGYSILPDTAQPDDVTFTTSDPKVVRVSRDGIVTATGEGRATVSLVATYGKLRKTASVRFSVSDPKKPVSVRLSVDASRLAVGDSAQVFVTPVPDTAVIDEMQFRSSSEKIATVAADGRVTAISEGTAVITVTVRRGSFRKTLTTRVTVFDPSRLTGLSLSADSTVIDIGETLSLTPVPQPATALPDTVSYRSSAPAIAMVSSEGIVTGLKPGSATITATAVRGSVRKTAVLKLTVTDKQPLTAVHVSAAKTELSIGATTDLRVGLEPEGAVAVSIRYASSSEKVVTVNSSGRVTAVGEGTASVTVTAVRGNITRTDSLSFTVTDPWRPTNVLISANKESIPSGATLQMLPTLVPESAQPETSVWSSSDTAIATVDQSGLVTAVSPGDVYITLTISYKGKSLYDSWWLVIS